MTAGQLTITGQVEGAAVRLTDRQERAKKLVTQRLGEGWIRRGAQTAPSVADGAYDPATAEIPF